VSVLAEVVPLPDGKPRRNTRSPAEEVESLCTLAVSAAPAEASSGPMVEEELSSASIR
jgi:hypothetical protein